MNTLYLHADESIYHPMITNRPSNLTDQYIVLFFGSILPLQGIDVILQAMDELKEHTDIHFICIGPITSKNTFRAKPISTNIQYINWLPQSELANYIAMADLCLAGHFHATIEKARRTIPGITHPDAPNRKPYNTSDYRKL